MNSLIINSLFLNKSSDKKVNFFRKVQMERNNDHKNSDL
jgi:hypothetical protein